MVAGIRALLVAKFQQSVNGLVQNQGGLLQDIQVLRRKAQVKRTRLRERIGQSGLVQYIPVLGREGEGSEAGWRIGRAVEDWLWGKFVVAVSPPLPDIGVLKQALSIHRTLGELRRELRKMGRGPVRQAATGQGRGIVDRRGLR